MAKPSPNYSGNKVLVRLGLEIKKKRKECGMSQEALAAEAGLDRSYMGGVERGEHNLTVMSLHRIATALNLKLVNIFDSTDS
jgi:transcriptional regulator with XRE-family HTH domain